MLLWLGVMLLAFLAEAIGDWASAYYNRERNKLRAVRAARWAVLLAALGWVDLSGIAVGWPLSALICGSIGGAWTGTLLAVRRQQVQARIRRKLKEADRERDRAAAGGDPGEADQHRDAVAGTERGDDRTG